MSTINSGVLSIHTPASNTKRENFRVVMNFQGMENYAFNEQSDLLPDSKPECWRFKSGGQIILGETQDEPTMHEISNFLRDFYVQWGRGEYKEAIPNGYFVYVPCGHQVLKPYESTYAEELEEWKIERQEE